MRKQRRQTPEINAGSMADIAFLLLIFWLVATTITPQFGWKGKLVDPDEEEQIAVVNEQNEIIKLYITEDGKYEIDGKEVSLERLREVVTRLVARSGFRSLLLLTSAYNAPYEAYADVLELGKQTRIKILENEITKN